MHCSVVHRSPWQVRRKYIDAGEELTAREMDDDWFDFLHRRDLILVGTPATCRRRSRRFGSVLVVSTWHCSQIPRALLTDNSWIISRYSESK